MSDAPLELPDTVPTRWAIDNCGTLQQWWLAKQRTLHHENEAETNRREEARIALKLAESIREWNDEPPRL